MSISCFITFFKIWPTGGAVLFFYFFCTYFDHVPTTFPPRTFLRLLRYIHWHKKIQACLCFLVHFSMFLACEARALRSLFFFFFFFWTQSPKFVDFWHFCNLFCLSMIKVQFYNVFWNFFLKLCSFFKRFLFLQKFSILHSHLLSFQMKFNTSYVLPNFGIQSIIFQNFQVFSKHLYLLLLKSILSKIFAAILLCFLK